MRLHLKIVGALAVALSISPSFAEKPKGYTYLALGDSIPYGFDPTKFVPPTVAQPFPPLPKPVDFIGYPEIVSNVKQLQHVHASCPGETSGSFLVFKARDNGCNGPGPQGQPAFKTSIGLHENYDSSQLAFARAQIRANKRINLITLSLGGNDLSLLQKDCMSPLSPFPSFDLCVGSQIDAVVANYGINLTMILKDLRERADYKGKLILVTNYSPNPLFNFAIVKLNETMKRVGKDFGARIADGFGAFEFVAGQFGGGNPCSAGLLVRLSPPGPNAVCDIHPSVDGQNLLAATVLFVAEKKNGKDDDD